MAISTYKTYLMYKDSDTYKKLTDITAFPDLGQSVQTIEVTTLSNSMQTFIPGIKANGLMTFNCYYDHETYARIEAMKDDQHDFAVYFGATGDDAEAVPTGSEGKFTFSGYISAHVAGAGTNAGVPMTIDIVPTTVVTDETT